MSGGISQQNCHTLRWEIPLQVAGFHWAVPSTTLDKACMQFVKYYSSFARKVKYFFVLFAKKIHKSVMDKQRKSWYDMKSIKELSQLKKLSRKFEQFCFKNRNKGIPNLMLYLVLGTGLVYLSNMINGGSFIYEMLAFDKRLILKGQVWRLVTWLVTDIMHSNPLLNIVFLYFFYSLGRNVEATIGTFKFNLFYLAGVVLMDVFAMIFCPVQDMIIGQYLVTTNYFTEFYSSMAFYLHLSLVLAFATCHPDSQFMIYFIIPIRAWVMALVYLVIIAIDVYNMCTPVNLMPHALFPLVGLLNYFLFFGREMPNLLPPSWRGKRGPRPAQTQRRTAPGEPIPLRREQKAAPVQNYNHRCTICGRTDVSNPELEFRYCSKCNGYHCYCQDHISNHTHVE